MRARMAKHDQGGYSYAQDYFGNRDERHVERLHRLPDPHVLRGSGPACAAVDFHVRGPSHVLGRMGTHLVPRSTEPLKTDPYTRWNHLVVSGHSIDVLILA